MKAQCWRCGGLGWIELTVKETKVARGKLFDYAILYHPREKKDAAGNPIETKKSQLIKRDTVLAVSDKEVGMLAAKSLPDEYLDKLEDVEIIVRPF